MKISVKDSWLETRIRKQNDIDVFNGENSIDMIFSKGKQNRIDILKGEYPSKNAASSPNQSSKSTSLHSPHPPPTIPAHSPSQIPYSLLSSKINAIESLDRRRGTILVLWRGTFALIGGHRWRCLRRRRLYLDKGRGGGIGRLYVLRLRRRDYREHRISCRGDRVMIWRFK